MIQVDRTRSFQPADSSSCGHVLGLLAALLLASCASGNATPAGQAAPSSKHVGPATTTAASGGCTSSLPYTQQVEGVWQPFVRVCGNAQNGATVISITNASRFMIDVYPTAGRPNIRLLSSGSSDLGSRLKWDAARRFDRSGPGSLTIPPSGSAWVTGTPGADRVGLVVDVDANLVAGAVGSLYNYVTRQASGQEQNLQNPLVSCAETFLSALDWFVRGNQSLAFSDILDFALRTYRECRDLVDRLVELEKAQSEQAERARIAYETRQDQEQVRAMDMSLRKELPPIEVIR